MPVISQSRIFIKVSLLIVAAITLFNILVFINQPSMLFYPYRQLDATPLDWGMQYEDVAITTSDGIRLHGWYLPAADAKKVVLFFHGNAGNISHRSESLAIFHSLGLSVLIIDYRGYGKSEGSVSEQGLYRDAVAAWNYLAETRSFKPDDIVIFGRSLGGAVAANLAGKVQPRALIVESTFSSTRDMANKMMPVLSRMIIMRYAFDTERAIQAVHAPVLVMHSRDDEIIPYELGKKVYEAAREPKTFYLLVGGHNDGFTRSMPGYRYRLKTFLEAN
jgi:fermentation-respiration switch protein FrsA (DUF1100 family)